MKKFDLLLLTIVITFLSSYLMAYTVEMDPTNELQNYVSLGEWNTDGNFDHWEFGDGWGVRYVSGGYLVGVDTNAEVTMATGNGSGTEIVPGTMFDLRIQFVENPQNRTTETMLRIDGSGSLYPSLKFINGSTHPIATNGEFHVYRLTLEESDDPKYFGTLTSIRLDPVFWGPFNEMFKIDYFRVASPPPEPFEPQVDNEYNRGLLHCDKAMTNQWSDGSADCFLTPDDNSSGRLACAPIMNASNNWIIARDDSTMPTFMTNSPYGGDYLAFDGNDSIIATNAWPGGDNLDLDLCFRFKDLPPLSGDNYAGLLWTLPVKAYLRADDDGVHGKVLMLVYDSAGNPHFFYSTKTINSNVWYHLNFSASNDTLKVAVGNVDEGYEYNTATATGLLAPGTFPDVIIGSDYFGPTRLFKGDIDEVRWGVVVPEPYYLSFIIYYLLFFIRINKSIK